MHSKKQLFGDLKELGFEDPSLEAPYIADETYGKHSFIYINCKDLSDRVRVEEYLRLKGYKVSLEYWPGAPRVEVAVSYFKGFQWDV